jgi:hypothetical protein
LLTHLLERFMNRQARTLALLGLVAALSTTLSITPTSIAAQPAAARSAGSVMVHLGSFTNDLHAAKMALKVATAMRQQGASVVLFVDREGVRLADTRQPIGLIYGSASRSNRCITRSSPPAAPCWSARIAPRKPA